MIKGRKIKTCREKKDNEMVRLESTESERFEGLVREVVSPPRGRDSEQEQDL